MNQEEYLELQQRIILLANLVKGMPLKEFIEAAEKADVVGPFVDPTLWRLANENLAVIIDLARRLLKFQEKAMIASLRVTGGVKK